MQRPGAGEMIVGPKKTMFLDEISTGLDSSTTFLIVKCIRNITKALQARDFSLASQCASVCHAGVTTTSLLDAAASLCWSKELCWQLKTTVAELEGAAVQKLSK